MRKKVNYSDDFDLDSLEGMEPEVDKGDGGGELLNRTPPTHVSPHRFPVDPFYPIDAFYPAALPMSIGNRRTL